ncbi:MAG: AAA ATPase [Claussenomyces sp. TS43310]|nr:MAG: AAA ATPase [Claussenomyces sp. TS43310]
MASSVLGKRTRSATDAGLPTSRPKRQVTRTAIYNDENDNPFVTRKNNGKAHDVKSLDLDELADATPIKSPLKHGGVRVLTAPSKIKTHFNTVKPGNDENQKLTDIQTPRTPRHRDASSKNAPTTPRHRVTVNGRLFTPQTPRTPSSGSNCTTIYNCARQLFTRSSDPGRLIGRDDERKELVNFITICCDRSIGGCMYVSGPPGTGKSAFVNEVISDMPETATFKKASINCMTMKSSKDIYAALLDSFCEDLDILEGQESITLQGLFIPRKRTATVYIVTLDEMDHVLSLDLEFMYKLFEWSLQKSSRLILIGIANALDLTDRFLPRLKARNLKPKLLPFLPYNASQIKAVIVTRLKSLVPADSKAPDNIPFLHPAAIELCSRKVASQTGDLRKALDICRRTIDLIEGETKQRHQQILDEQLDSSPSRKVLGENVNLSSPETPSRLVQRKTLSQSLASLTVETAPRASISHVNKITSAVFANGSVQRLKALNLQQKAALCSLVALEKRKRAAATNVMATPSKLNNAAPTVKALYDTYCMLCRRDSVLQPLTSSEFRDVIGSLETLSLISPVDGKNGSFVAMNTPSKRGRKPVFGAGVGTGDEKRVGSCVSEKEVEHAIDGLGAAILKSILSGEGLE